MDKQCLYAFQSRTTGLIKIGRSSDANRRACELEKIYKMPFSIISVLPNAGKFERQVHWILRRYWCGKEWFDIPRDACVRLLRKLGSKKGVRFLSEIRQHGADWTPIGRRSKSFLEAIESAFGKDEYRWPIRDEQAESPLPADERRVMDLSLDDLTTQVAKLMSRKRWENKTKEQRSAHGKMMIAARNKKISKKRKAEISRIGGLARAAKHAAAERSAIEERERKS